MNTASFITQRNYIEANMKLSMAPKTMRRINILNLTTSLEISIS